MRLKVRFDHTLQQLGLNQEYMMYFAGTHRKRLASKTGKKGVLNGNLGVIQRG